MPQQILLDISCASARARGQARRRYQPALSRDDRKAQRNHVRRERAKLKKTGEAEQRVLTPIQSLPFVGRSQRNVPSPFTPEATHKAPDGSLLQCPPAIVELPAHADIIYARALARSENYFAAKPARQKSKDIVHEDFHGFVSNPETHDENTPRVTPEGHVVLEHQIAAEILSDFAKEQHPIPPTMESGLIEESATAYAQECPVTACWYHEHGFSSKAQRDKHAMTHYEGDHKCNDCNILNGTEGKFLSAEYFKNHVRKHHMTSVVKCQICFQLFEGSDFPGHLDDCILHTVELEASGRVRGCPLVYCAQYLRSFSSKELRDQHMMEHYWPSLSYRQ